MIFILFYLFTSI